jgi:hypothetical protein
MPFGFLDPKTCKLFGLISNRLTMREIRSIKSIKTNPITFNADKTTI